MRGSGKTPAISPAVGQGERSEGVANVLGSLSQSYPASGSFSRSAVNLDASARSGMSSVFAGILVLVTLLFLTPFFHYPPQSVLAAVIMMAVIGVINFKAIRHAWEAHPHDGAAAVGTFIATLALAPHLDNGILVGAGLAVGLFLYRTMTPRVALLGRCPDGTLRDLRIHPTLPTDERDRRPAFRRTALFRQCLLFRGHHPKRGG